MTHVKRLPGRAVLRSAEGEVIMGFPRIDHDGRLVTRALSGNEKSRMNDQNLCAITAVEIVNEGIIVVFADGDVSYFPACMLHRFQYEFGFQASANIIPDA